MTQGIFDDLVATARRIDLGSNAPGRSPSIVAGFGVPTAVEATGSIYYRQDGSDAGTVLYVRAANAWWPIGGSSGATQLQASAAWNIGVLGGLTRINTDINVPGLSVGDFALASLSGGGFANFSQCELTSWVVGIPGEGVTTYAVRVNVFNAGGGNTDIGNVTARVLVFKHA